ncbi:hypothetical protein HN51_001741 [Arachis hypogaea]
MARAWDCFPRCSYGNRVSPEPDARARHTNNPHTAHPPPRSANPARPDRPPPARLGACRQAKAYGSVEPTPLGRVQRKRRRTFKGQPEALGASGDNRTAAPSRLGNMHNKTNTASGTVLRRP